MKKIIKNLITENKMKHFIIALSIITFTLPSKSILREESINYNSNDIILREKVQEELKNNTTYVRERARIKRQQVCNLQNPVGLTTYSSLLIAQNPQPLPIFPTNLNCKIRRV